MSENKDLTVSLMDDNATADTISARKLSMTSLQHVEKNKVDRRNKNVMLSSAIVLVCLILMIKLLTRAFKTMSVRAVRDWWFSTL